MQQRAGARKRARETLDALTPASRSRSALADFLIQQQCWGFMSAPEVQRIADLACQDMRDAGCTAPVPLVTLAELGSPVPDARVHGSVSLCNRYNTHRDLMKRVIEPRLKIRALTLFTLPVRVKAMFGKHGRFVLAPRVVEAQYAMVSPHLFFSQLYHLRRQTFFDRILGCSTDVDVASHLRGWWSKLAADDPRVRDLVAAYVGNGTVTDRHDFMSRAVPLVLHGDAVPCGNRGSFDALTVSSLLVQNLSTIDSKILISGIEKRNIATSSLDSLWSTVAWSLFALLSGKHPLRSFNAQPLPPELSGYAGRDLCDGLVL